METYGLDYAAGSSGALFSREQSVADPFQPCSFVVCLISVLFLSMEAGQPAVGLSVAFREKQAIRWPSFRSGVVILAEGLVLGLRSWGLLNRQGRCWQLSSEVRRVQLTDPSLDLALTSSQPTPGSLHLQTHLDSMN